MHIISSKYVVKPEHREAFIEVQAAFAAKTAQDGVMLMTTCDVNDPNVFYIWAEHRTAEIMAEIEASGAITDRMGKIGTFLADTPHIRHLTVSDVETYMEP